MLDNEYEWVRCERTLEGEVERDVHNALNQQVQQAPMGYDELANVLQNKVDEQEYPIEQVLDAVMTSEYVVESGSGYKISGKETKHVDFGPHMGTLQLRNCVSGALDRLVKRSGRYHSQILDESTTVRGNEEFVNKAWQYFKRSSTNQDAQEVQDIIRSVTHESNYDRLAEARDNNAAFQEFRDKQREILEDTFDSNSLPLFRGIGPKYIASRSPAFDYHKSKEKSWGEEFGEERFERIVSHVQDGKTRLERDDVDSWTSDPSTAIKFGLNGREDVGFVLRQVTEIDEIVHSDLMFPGDLSEHESTLSGSKEQFQPEQFTSKRGSRGWNPGEEEYIWLYRNLP
jgi:hypothetical protein